MTIQRYHAGNLRPDQKKSWKADDGIFVLYVDHLAALAEKDKQIAALKDERNELKKQPEVRMETVLFSNRENKRLKELCAELVGPDMKREIE